MSPPPWVRRFHCTPCGKWSYPNRKRARQAGRKFHPGAHMHPYPCPAGNGWHTGHRIGSGQRQLRKEQPPNDDGRP